MTQKDANNREENFVFASVNVTLILVSTISIIW